MKTKQMVAAELRASKQYLLFSRNVHPDKLIRLKPIVDKIKFDFKNEKYNCVNDMINELAQMQARIKFNMELQYIDATDNFLFTFMRERETLKVALLFYDFEMNNPYYLYTRFTRIEPKMQLILLADRVVVK